MDKRRVSRHFMTETDKKQAYKMYSDGYSIVNIAEKIRATPRQVKEFIQRKESGCKLEFTQEEEAQLIDLYFHGIQKEAKIAKFIKTKTAYMIRSKIKKFKKAGLLPDKVMNKAIRFEELHEKETETPNIKGEEAHMDKHVTGLDEIIFEYESSIGKNFDF